MLLGQTMSKSNLSEEFHRIWIRKSPLDFTIAELFGLFQSDLRYYRNDGEDFELAYPLSASFMAKFIPGYQQNGIEYVWLKVPGFQSLHYEFAKIDSKFTAKIPGSGHKYINITGDVKIGQLTNSLKLLYNSTTHLDVESFVDFIQSSLLVEN